MARARDGELARCLGVYHATIERNKRCVLAYL
jgi:hypothetical protein